MATAQKEGRFVWYDSVPVDEAKRISDEFKSKYPGIETEYVEMVAAQRVSRIIQESRAGGPTADVFTYFPQVIMTLAGQDMVRKLDWSSTGLQFSDKQAPNPYMLLTHAVPYLFLTNSRKVAEADVPAVLADVLKPRWQGTMGLWSTAGAFLELLAKWPEKQVVDYVNGIAALSPRLYSSPRALAEAVGAGEIELGAFVPQATIGQTIARGAPVRVTWIDPIPNTVIYGAVPKLGRNPNAAQLFLSWVASEGAPTWEKVSSRGNPTVPSTQLFQQLRNRELAELPIETILSEADRLNTLSTSILRTLQRR